MTDIVVAVHPARMTFLPLRGRDLQDRLVRMDSPMRMVERSPGEFTHVFDLPSRHGIPSRRLLSGQNGLWEEVSDEAGRAVPVNDLLAWMADSDCPRASSAALDLWLDGTPLAAHGDGVIHDPARLRRSFRGEDGESGSWALVHDGRDAARAALAAFLHDEVSVVGRHVLLKVRPLAVVDLWGAHAVSLAPPRGDPDFRVLPARPERLDAALAEARDPRGPDPAVVAAWRALERLWPDEGEEARWALNAWSGPLRRLMDHCLSLPWVDADACEEIAAVAARLRESELEALTGGAGRVSPRGPFYAMVRAAALGERYAVGRVEALDLAGFRDRLVRHLAPTLPPGNGDDLDLEMAAAAVPAP